MSDTNDKNKKIAKIMSLVVLFLFVLLELISIELILIKNFTVVTCLYVVLPLYKSFLVIKNTNLKTDNFRSVTLDLIIPIISGYLYIFLAFLNIEYNENGDDIRKAGFTTIPSLMIWIGYFMVLFSVIYLRKYFTVFAEANGLVKTGPYKYIRNPIYSGYIISAIGGLIKYYSLEVAAVMIFSFMLYFVRAYEEEKLLQDKFGQEYIEYKQYTGRFFPKIL